MAFRFSDGKRWRDLGRMLWHHACGGRLRWHNRAFTVGQRWEPTDRGSRLVWPGRGTLDARSIESLPRHGDTACILASGPSVGRIRGLERLFDQPVACVNGSVSLAHDLGRRVDYFIVSDHRFILEKPDLFRLGAGLADAVVLTPMTAFTAMLRTPDALAADIFFIQEDLRRPFKRPRPTRAELLRDPQVIAHPSHDLCFSLNPRRGIWPSGTVVYDAIQLLFGIGYRELFMFGVDLSDEPRFYREGVASPTQLTADYAAAILPAFELVRDYLRQSGRTLVNASPASRLPPEVIPKADGNAVLDLLASRGARRS